jgi:hypothetical protein
LTLLLVDQILPDFDLSLMFHDGADQNSADAIATNEYNARYRSTAR